MNPAAKPSSFNDSHFQKIIEIAATDAGIAIPETKKSLVQSRVTKRMREIGIATSGEYLVCLDQSPQERSELISALTTNVSHFYREDHHFEYIRERILNRPDTNKLRFWSAGCSNGQEPYTLAYEILKAIPDASKRDILVLANDIDPYVVKKAKAGIYSDTEIDGVPSADRMSFFEERSGSYMVRPEIAALVRFRQLNLIGEWPMRGKFDAIFCRNVVIYFNDETQRKLWPRFGAQLQTGGLLMLGHSERLHPMKESGFENAGVTTYQKF